MINKLLLKIGVYFVEKLIEFYPDNIPLKAIRQNLKVAPEKKETVILHSLTILKDDKALLTYKGTDEKYYTKIINYRVGEIKPVEWRIVSSY